MTDWISVDDRLPSADEKVLVFSQRYHRFGFVDSHKKWCIKHGFDYTPSKNVTHWMPLPAPPT